MRRWLCYFFLFSKKQKKTSHKMKVSMFWARFRTLPEIACPTRWLSSQSLPWSRKSLVRYRQKWLPIPEELTIDLRHGTLGPSKIWFFVYLFDKLPPKAIGNTNGFDFSKYKTKMQKQHFVFCCFQYFWRQFQKEIRSWGGMSEVNGTGWLIVFWQNVLFWLPRRIWG